MDFHARQVLGIVAQVLFHHGAHVFGKGFGAFDVLIGIDLDLHVLKVRRKHGLSKAFRPPLCRAQAHWCSTVKHPAMSTIISGSNGFL